MKRIWQMLGKVVLSLVMIGLLAGLFSIGPFVEKRSPVVPTVEPPGESTEVAAVPDAGGGVGEGVFRLGDWSLETRRTEVAPCRADTWALSSLGFCTEGCDGLNVERGSDTAKFSWLQGGGIHTLSLECEADGSRGSASHFVIPFDANAAASTSGIDRANTVPLLPGATEVYRYGSGPLAIFVDRPRLTATALEELELELLSRGWRRMAIPSFLRLPAFSASKVFLRGREFCVTALQSDSTDDLLISAYGHEGKPPEAPQ